MDDHAGIAYGTRICIKELNIKYNKLIVFAVCIYYLPVVISTYNKDKQMNLNDLQAPRFRKVTCNISAADDDRNDYE